MTESNRLTDLVEQLRNSQSHIGAEAADAIELLQRELRCSEDLWEQQKELSLEYLSDIKKASDIIAEQAEEIHELKGELANWVQFWRDKDNKALKARIEELEEFIKKQYQQADALQARIKELEVLGALKDEHLAQACNNIKKRDDCIVELKAALEKGDE